MRRFSQRNSLVTLSDINITPLLDLAFVLLIIFVITAPLLEQGLNLKLPQGDVPDSMRINPNDVRTVEIHPRGYYRVGATGPWLNVDQASAQLVQVQQINPNLIVYIRADERSPYKLVADLLYRLERGGVDKISLRTDPVAR